MKTKTHKLTILFATLLLSACGADISDSLDDSADSGSADFTTFVAVGDSLTAGYKDSALYLEGQQNSYPAILAQQFARAGGGAFTQPERSADATGSFVGIPTDQIADRLVVVSSGRTDPPVTAATIDPTNPTPLAPNPGLYNNFGVPGAKSFHLTLDSYGDPAGIALGTANPFYVRFATVPAGAGVGSSVIGDAAARAPTFFILWIGNNDILLNATAGMPGTDNPTFGVGSRDVTPVATFQATYPGLVAALKTATNKGVLVNVPKVTSIPYFTTVSYDSITLTADKADALNAQLSLGYDAALDAAVTATLIDAAEADRRRISYQAGTNPVLISDETLTDISAVLTGPLQGLALLAQARPATANDLVVLPASSKLGVEDPTGGPLGTGGDLAVWGVTQPLLDTDVLIDVEVEALETVRSAYNATIAAQANDEIALFDAASVLEELATNGLSYGSGGISATYIQGGGFSLDGVHPTARGYAVVANEIMKVIESAFGAKLPPVDPNRYSTVFYQ